MKNTSVNKKPAESTTKKSKADGKKVSNNDLSDKDEKVQKHRATDIQKPVVNKK